MSDFLKDFGKESMGVLKKYIWIPLTVVAILCLIFSGVKFVSDITYLSQALQTIGTSILTSIVFLAIVKSDQFTEIFKTQLKKVIYCTDYLKNREDIKDLWITVSKSMYKEDYPELCDIIEENLEKYIPSGASKYYKNYVYKVDISFDEENPDFINLSERETFELISNRDKEIKYLASCVFNKTGHDDEITHYKMDSFYINKKLIEVKEPEMSIDNKYKGNKIRVSHERKLKGNNRYEIEKNETKKYSLKVENTKSHNCQHIFKDYTLEVTHPKELDVKFYENGTLNRFEQKPIRKIGESVVKRFEYKGIMFKNQGTRLIFRDLRK